MDTTALIAAGSAILGSIVPQAFLLLAKRGDRKHERHQLHWAKLEEMATLTNRALIGSLAAKTSDESDVVILQAESARRIYVLALLYFPSLKAYAQDFFVSTYNLQSAFEQNNKEAAIAASAQIKKALDDLEQGIQGCAEKWL